MINGHPTLDDYWYRVEAPGHDAVEYDPGAWGKWLVFVPADDARPYWTLIKSAVLAGQLGPSAKIPVENAGRRSMVIVVYTTDWRNQPDVRRVLRVLRRLGFGGRLSYKTDAATSAGRYGRGAATYVSAPGSADFC